MGQKLGDHHEPAAGQRALRREVLHAGNDGYHPQPRPETTRPSKPSSPRATNPRFAYDCYRRFIQMYGAVVLEVPQARFRRSLRRPEKEGPRPSSIPTSPPRTCSKSSPVTKSWSRRRPAKPFPAGTPSCNSPAHAMPSSAPGLNERAKYYRKMNQIPDDLGTAVNVQAMVFGNLGENLRHRRRLHAQPPPPAKRPSYGEFPGERAGRRRGGRHSYAAPHQRP